MMAPPEDDGRNPTLAGWQERGPNQGIAVFRLKAIEYVGRAIILGQHDPGFLSMSGG
jgi:hypothetical protein